MMINVFVVVAAFVASTIASHKHMDSNEIKAESATAMEISGGGCPGYCPPTRPGCPGYCPPTRRGCPGYCPSTRRGCPGYCPPTKPGCPGYGGGNKGGDDNDAPSGGYRRSLQRAY
ncbi:hypothetical protein HIM_11196 [Hirsutella minnesotensis 3608]|uniref:Uncharacterized protein n=1 Tax=Hirsutella minnesotensis 3608 TaxID=1043627 RepID=A0A0F7ZRD5_9HYPO|nr:hypothetical protein HIM_11196 [Hirsutella minnesotensis 3608]